MRVFDIIFLDDRPKNAQTLSQLEITPKDREDIIEDLVAEDYVDGPFDEDFHGGKEMWVFGKALGNNEIYIKITLGMHGRRVICISFHVAEYTMRYPLKEN